MPDQLASAPRICSDLRDAMTGMIRATANGMVSTLAEREAPHRSELAAAMAESGRVETRLTSHSVPGARPAKSGTPRRPTSGDGVLALCLLVLVGVVIAGLLLALFSWVTAALPQHATECPA